MSVSTPPGITFEDFFNRIVPAAFFLVVTSSIISIGQFVILGVELTTSDSMWGAVWELNAPQFLVLFTFLLIYGEVISAIRTIIIPVPPTLVKIFEDVPLSDGDTGSPSSFFVGDENELPFQESLNELLAGKQLELSIEMTDWLFETIRSDRSLPFETGTARERAELFYHVVEPTISARTKRYQLLLDFYYNMKLSFIAGVIVSFGATILMILSTGGLQRPLWVYLLVTLSVLFTLYMLGVYYFGYAEREWVRALIFEYSAKRQSNEKS